MCLIYDEKQTNRLYNESSESQNSITCYKVLGQCPITKTWHSPIKSGYVWKKGLNIALDLHNKKIRSHPHMSHPRMFYRYRYYYGDNMCTIEEGIHVFLNKQDAETMARNYRQCSDYNLYVCEATASRIDIIGTNSRRTEAVFACINIENLNQPGWLKRQYNRICWLFRHINQVR